MRVEPNVLYAMEEYEAAVSGTLHAGQCPPPLSAGFRASNAWFYMVDGYRACMKSTDSDKRYLELCRHGYRPTVAAASLYGSPDKKWLSWAARNPQAVRNRTKEASHATAK
ncbi:hypothetical protein [Bifidobacterium biavatii]|uniref:Uncharacterized protein n=1 Tax=Bifidobacterium biavatii DSM 23969 TaxID=1437608 RepID=A0A086ZUH4_9BIFI|nr:hypothetical protein [Bifidobacterium biavatii]KFI50174.1 hypothetical protein BBIA_1656 [Bifidobacterium biavatii DSM 23969]